jgi:hypothetical protein
LWFCHMKICFLISGRHGVSPKRNEGVVSNASISGSRFGPGGKVTTVTGEEDVTDGCNCLCFHRSQTCVSSLVRGRVVGYRRCSVTSHASISRLHPHDARTTRGPSDPGLHGYRFASATVAPSRSALLLWLKIAYFKAYNCQFRNGQTPTELFFASHVIPSGGSCGSWTSDARVGEDPFFCQVRL